MWLQNHLISPFKILHTQADLVDGDFDQLLVPEDDDRHLSTDTVIYYQKVFRDIIADFMISVSSGYMVGGPGTTIEIDESMFGKRALLSLFLYFTPFGIFVKIFDDNGCHLYKCDFPFYNWKVTNSLWISLLFIIIFECECLLLLDQICLLDANLCPIL